MMELLPPKEDTVFVAINCGGAPLATTALEYSPLSVMLKYRYTYGRENKDIRVAEYRLVPVGVVEMPEAVTNE